MTRTRLTRREAYEEAAIPQWAPYIPLQATCCVPVNHFARSAVWGKDTFVVPEHSFGGDCTVQQIALSHEHTELQWPPYAEAHKRLTYDGNRTDLWELNQRTRDLEPHGGLVG